MNTLKLNALESSSLSKKEMNLINGGNRVCVCACNFEGQEGGSSRVDNGRANYGIGSGGGHSDDDLSHDLHEIATAIGFNGIVYC
jgi:natural product precursor